MKTRLVILFALGLLTASGCKKDGADALPKATQSGAQTAGCLIDGEVFVAKKRGSGMSSVPAIMGGFSFDSLYVVRFVGTHGGKEAAVQLFLRHRSPGTYLLNRNTGYYPATISANCLDHAVYEPNDNFGGVYVTSAQHTGQITLTYVDRARLIAAGTFEFTARNATTGKTIRITDGRFDRKQ